MRNCTIHKAVRRGVDHPNFCEDFLATYESGEYILGATFDGCSGGIHSHFASALMGKVFNNITRQYHDVIDAMITAKAVGKFVLFEFAQKVYQTQTYLRMHPAELQSTILLMVYHKKLSDAFVIAIGDGFISVKTEDIAGEVSRQDIYIENTRYGDDDKGLGVNKPDYIIGDLENIQEKDKYDEWFASKKDQYYFERVHDITIASDGIETFSRVRTPKKEDDIDVVEFLIKDLWQHEFAKKIEDEGIMMKKKLNKLDKIYGLGHKDDLSIIRLVVEKVPESKSEVEPSKEMSA